MGNVVSGLFGGGGQKPAVDPELQRMQREQMQRERERSDGLAAEEAARRRSMTAAAQGRSLLLGGDETGAPKSTLGG